jgi:hypothetical protein
MLQGMGAGLVLFCQLAMADAPETADEPKTPAAKPEPSYQKASVPVTSEATITFRNEVGDKFQLMQGRFVIDGVEVPEVTLDSTPGKETVIFKGPMTSGRHVISSRIAYQGRNRSIFTYLQGYTLNLENTEEVFVVSGETSKATLVAKEHKGFTVPYEQSLVVDFEARGAMTGALRAAR